MFSIDNILFTLGGQQVSLLELLAVTAGLSCVFLATRGRVLNFWVGYLYNILLFFMFLQKHLFSSMLVQPISFVINFFGHYRWTHPAQNEKDRNQQLKITLLTNKERVMLLGVVVAFTVGWGLLLSNLNVWWPDTFPMARTPFLDSFVTAFILLAQYLSAQKKLDCWGAWLVVNVTNIILYVKAGLVFMPLVSAGYLIIAFFGFAMWRKQWKAQEN